LEYPTNAITSAKEIKMKAVVTIFLQKQADVDVALLQELMDEISDRARARGLTPEILESILHER